MHVYTHVCSHTHRHTSAFTHRHMGLRVHTNTLLLRELCSRHCDKQMNITFSPTAPGLPIPPGGPCGPSAPGAPEGPRGPGGPGGPWEKERPLGKTRHKHPSQKCTPEEPYWASMAQPLTIWPTSPVSPFSPGGPGKPCGQETGEVLLCERCSWLSRVPRP